jgi:hypothetical protein
MAQSLASAPLPTIMAALMLERTAGLLERKTAIQPIET